MVNVIGLGYIGLPTALMLAANGADVYGTDCNKSVVENLKKGKITFEERGLEELLGKANRNITFGIEYKAAEFYIITVPTPYDVLTKKIDVKYVLKAVEDVLAVAPRGAIVIIESTISPGTIDKCLRPLIYEKYGMEIGTDIHLVHAPERIIPGNMVYELANNARTIGADDTAIGNKVKDLYSIFCCGEIIVTDIKTAEMTKVIENTYRDINIAFANELAKICNIDGMDVYEIIRIANKHPRVNILQPGPGVGGHCISVDPWFIVGDHPLSANMIYMARKINDSMPEYVLQRIYDIMQANSIGGASRVGIYGLAYKEDVDDCRESPTLQLLDNMKRHLSMPIKVYDPMIKYSIVDNQYFDFEKFVADIDMLVVMVGHKHLLNNIESIRDKIIYDTRNIVKLENVYKL